MNEKIKELYVRALSEAGEDGEAAMVEKFAELIVQECAQLVEDNMDPQNAWITPAFIKEHFGVEG